MQAAGRRSPVTRRQIADVLYPGGLPRNTPTVALVQRLEDKGFFTSYEKEAYNCFSSRAARRADQPAIAGTWPKLASAPLDALPRMNLGPRARQVSPEELDALTATR